MAGWNFYIYEALLIPFEITALNLVLSFWRDDIPVAAVCAACVVLYGSVLAIPLKRLCVCPRTCFQEVTLSKMAAEIMSSLLNLLAVKAYGEAEFWLSGGKVLLIFML